MTAKDLMNKHGLNIFQYAACVENMLRKALNEYGYELFTTFANDFAIADAYGISAVKDTYNRCFEHFKNDVKYYTELVMVLNHLSWFWNSNQNKELCGLYVRLYQSAYDKGFELFSGDELSYFINTLD